mmetsp:Transcript_7864/g.14227  ORF Transcript_7864/g.14227 Transcript_7864/m.14227 type:complete len:126 (-) Transcript_7864:1318-1695(-)
MTNNEGRTKLVIDTEKHPMKLTMCTKAEPKNSATSVHMMQKVTLTEILLIIGEYLALSIPIFPSMSSPNGTTMSGADTITANAIKRRTSVEIQVLGIASNTSPSNMCPPGENNTRIPFDMAMYPT